MFGITADEQPTPVTSEWRSMGLVLGTAALALALAPWAVLTTSGLDMAGHMLITAQLLLGFVGLVLVARVGEQRADPSSRGASAAVVLLAVGGAAFTALSGAMQAQPFALTPHDVQAFPLLRGLVLAGAITAGLLSIIGAIHRRGEGRNLELALATQCALVALAAATWSPLADLTHPMQPALLAAV